MSSAAERVVNGKREMTEGLATQILDHVRSMAGSPPERMSRRRSWRSGSASPAFRSARPCSSWPRGRPDPRAQPRLLRLGRAASSPSPSGLSARDDPRDARTSGSPTTTFTAACPTRPRKPPCGSAYGPLAGAAQRGPEPDRPGGLGGATPGYGWSFSPMLTTPESLEQTYRVRLALEPAALLEPTYRLDPIGSALPEPRKCGSWPGAIETDSADALHERGVRFHEAIIGASGNPFFLRRSAASTACAACCPTARCSTEGATASNARSTCRSSTCWSARRRGGLPSPAPTPRTHGRQP